MFIVYNLWIQVEIIYQRDLKYLLLLSSAIYNSLKRSIDRSIDREREREREKSREIEREEREDPQNFELLKPEYKVSANLNIFQVVREVVVT